MSHEDKISRRGFFQFGYLKGRQATGNAVMAGIKHKFKRTMIRPPGALPEPEFLVSCTRCGKCVDACSPGAIHLVDLVSGGVLARTPFIDPYYRPCNFCEDKTCVTACEPGALALPDQKIGLAHVDSSHCLISQGQICDYCFKSCPPGVKAIRRSESGVPEIDADLCVGCGKCAYICVSQTGKAIRIKPLD